jgi:periplasmic divalent cation tolerance protein
MKRYLVVYITSENKDEALKISRTLLEKRLIACSNIYDGVDSLYRWEGKIENNSEAVIIAKTRSGLLDDVIKTVKSVHGYSCPCIIAYPVYGGSGDFLKWIDRETSGRAL